jgi:hypothetical protein
MEIKMKLKLFFKLCVLLLLLPLLVQSFAKGQGSSSGNSLRKTLGSPSTAKFNINNISTFIYNDGTADINGSNPGYIFPALGSNTACFQSGFLFGGYVGAVSDNQLRIGGSVYRTSLTPGRIISDGVAEDPTASDARIYRVRPDYLTGSVSKEILDEGKSEQSIRAQYALDWTQWPAAQGAPFTYGKDANGNQRTSGDYDPNYDIPGAAGADQTIWFVANDLNTTQAQTFYKTVPLGVEVQCTVWGYNQSGALGNMLFKKYILINKNQDHKDFNQFYVSYWSDVDIGGGLYDYSGCDTTRSLFYTFAGQIPNAEYSNTPPATGIDFMQGPRIKTGNATDTAIFRGKYITGYKNLPMTSDYYFINVQNSIYSDPDQTSAQGTIEWYNLFQAKIAISGQPFTDPTTNKASKYPLYGDPVANTGWLDNIQQPPGDRRNGGVSGPFTLAYGDTQEVVIAEMSAGDGVGGVPATNNLGAVTQLKAQDDIAQIAYNRLFQLPSPAPAPKLKIISSDQKFSLSWGYDTTAVKATENYVYNLNGTQYKFQGYNLYQLPSASAGISQAKKLATYDIVDTVTTITELAPDPSSGILLPVVVQNGTNTGIKRFYIDSIDVFTNSKFNNSSKYYFAVTSYSYNPNPPFGHKVLENPLVIITATPHANAPGVDTHANPGADIPYQHIGLSDGKSIVTVIDPAQFTGHQYKVSFETATDADGNPLWKLTDSTTHVVKLRNQIQNQGNNGIILDGFQISVNGPSPESINTATLSPSSLDWLTGYSGGSALGGGLDLASNFLGPNALTNDQYRTVEIRFLPTPTGQNAYRWLRGGTPNYGYQDYKPQYFTVWDVTSTPNVQLSAAYVTQSGRATEKLPWQPTNNPGSDREYLFVMATPYSSTPSPLYSNPNVSYNATGQATLPMMYSLWPSLTKKDTIFTPQAGQKLTITPYFVNTLADQFLFTPTKSDTSVSQAKTDINKINVFPNPYYGVNPQELDKYSRWVTFTHLPTKATIRIYNLAGQLVRTIQKNSTDQDQRWDLLTDNSFPVASGLYIVYVDMPDLGKSKILKVAVIQEQQILDHF